MIKVKYKTKNLMRNFILKNKKLVVFYINWNFSSQKLNEMSLSFEFNWEQNYSYGVWQSTERRRTYRWCSTLESIKNNNTSINYYKKYEIKRYSIWWRDIVIVIYIDLQTFKFKIKN